MDRYRIIEVKQSVFADNDAAAERLRGELDAQGTYLINLMSSPGSGKTTTLLRLLPLLQRQLRVGVMEADIDSDVDADTVSRTGAKGRGLRVVIGKDALLDLNDAVAIHATPPVFV